MTEFLHKNRNCQGITDDIINAVKVVITVFLHVGDIPTNFGQANLKIRTLIEKADKLLTFQINDNVS